MSDFRGPLFVVGMPRSGTKLLRGLLNEHSQIGIPLNETEFLPHWINNWSSWGDLSDPRSFHRFFDAVSTNVYFTHRLKEHGQQIDPDHWHSTCADFTVPAVFEALIRHDAGVEPGMIWGDKSPGYIVHLQLLKTQFPTARFIHIVRDVRDYAMSMKKAFGKSMTRASQRWSDRITEAHRQAAAFPDDVIEVRYEDLLSDPAPVLRRICDFLNIDFEADMMALSRAPENIGDTRGQAQIVSDNTEKWRSQMSPSRTRQLERLAGDALLALGYPVTETTRRRLTTPEQLALQVYDGVRLIQKETEQRGLVDAVRFRLRLFAETGGLLR